MYGDDLWKVIGALLVLNLFLFITFPLFLAEYDIVVSPKPVEVLEQQSLLAQISSLEKDNEDLRVELASYPPKPINYSGTIVAVCMLATAVCVFGILCWTNLKETKLKILQETKGGKKK